MVRPWFGIDTGTSGAEAYRGSIEEFAENIIEAGKMKPYRVRVMLAMTSY